MNINEFMEGIHIIQDVYHQKFSKEQLNEYFEGLKDMNKNKYIANIRMHIKTNKFIPNIAQIRNEDKEIPMNLNNINLNSSYWYINLRELCEKKGIPYYDIKTGKTLEPYKV